MKLNEHFITLNTGAKMPLLGLGTWNASKENVGAAVTAAGKRGLHDLQNDYLD